MNEHDLARTSLCLLLCAAGAAAQLDWTPLSGGGAPGWGTAAAWDAARDRLVAFGGVVAGLPTDITSEWAGTAWVARTPPGRPSARSFASMAFDAARAQCVMFGGAVHPAMAVDETWTWDGTAWTRHLPLTSPSARMSAAIAYDDTRRVVTVFGGWLTPAFAVSDETWEWNGATWTQRTSLGATPPPRRSAAMVHDAERGITILCGGYDHLTGSSLNDTWTWDGTTWTRMSNLPIAMSDHALDYDVARRRVVLTGGQHVVQGSLVTHLDQVFEWDGLWWTSRATQRSVGARALFGHGYDTVNHRVVVAGGITTGATLGDTLALAPLARGEFTEFGTGCASSAGPLMLTSSGLPYLGLDFVQEVRNAPSSAACCILLFGFSNSVRTGVSLPLAMGAFGAPGCSLLVSDDIVLDIPLQGGVGSHVWRVPTQAGLVGRRLYTQAFVVDPLLPSALPIGASAARAARIGSP